MRRGIHYHNNGHYEADSRAPVAMDFEHFARTARITPVTTHYADHLSDEEALFGNYGYVENHEHHHPRATPHLNHHQDFKNVHFIEHDHLDRKRYPATRVPTDVQFVEHDHLNHQMYQAPEVHKNVHFVEHEKITETDRNGNREIYEEKTIDVEADGFINQQHRSFDLSKWDTFKAY